MRPCTTPSCGRRFAVPPVGGGTAYRASASVNCSPPGTMQRGRSRESAERPWCGSIVRLLELYPLQHIARQLIQLPEQIEDVERVVIMLDDLSAADSTELCPEENTCRNGEVCRQEEEGKNNCKSNVCASAANIAASLAQKHYIIRTSWVIGDGNNFVKTMLGLATKDVSPTVVSDQIGRLTFTGELVRAIDHLLTKKIPYSPPSKPLNLTQIVEGTQAIKDAMVQANVKPDDIDYINAHGSGTKQNDRHETAAYKLALGNFAYQIPISSIKSMIGHSLGSIGSMEMAACALAIDRSKIPPTANLEKFDSECDLNYTPFVAINKQVNVALSVASGFSGFQSAMLFSRIKIKAL